MPVIRDIIQTKRDSLNAEALPDFKEGFLTSLMARGDARPEEQRIHKDYIHVSSMVDWCPRRYVLQALSKEAIPSYVGKAVTGADRVMWALGRAAEKHVRDTVIREVNYAGVFGVWICVCEKSEHTGFYNERLTCQFCKGKLRHYKEFTLFDDDSHVSGNPDMLLVRRKRIYPVEVKSLTNSESANAKKRGFDTISSPFGDHMFQVDSYHYLLERNFDPSFGLIPGDKVIVLYVNKEYKWGKPYKEYWKPAVDHKRKTLIRNEFNKAKRVHAAIHGHAELPKRTLCPDCTCSRAAACPVVQQCFARK